MLILNGGKGGLRKQTSALEAMICQRRNQTSRAARSNEIYAVRNQHKTEWERAACLANSIFIITTTVYSVDFGPFAEDELTKLKSH